MKGESQFRLLRERRFRRSEDAHVFRAGRHAGEAARVAFGRRTLAGRYQQARQPPERRIAGSLAQLDLAGIEGLAIGGHQRPQDRVVGLVGLQIADAAARLAPGTADDLMQQLKGALGGARIAVGKAEIGVHHPHQIEPGKMMSLGDQLGADDDVEAACGHLVQLLAQALERFDEVAGQHQDAAPREQRGRLLLQPLDAGTDRYERVDRLALRTARRRRLREAAMMADQAAPEAVIDQPGIAVGTGQAKSALPAERERRVAATVEEQERLLAALDRAPHRLRQSRRDEAPARRTFEAQIDRLDGGKMRSAEAFRQVQAGVAAAPGVDLALDRRRGRHQHDRNGGFPRAHDRHVAGVIAHAVLLLVCRVVLLVDDDEPEIGVR